LDHPGPPVWEENESSFFKGFFFRAATRMVRFFFCAPDFFHGVPGEPEFRFPPEAWPEYACMLD